MLDPTAAEIDAFREDGFLVVEHIIDEATVGTLRDRFERLFRGEFETGVMPDEVNWQQGAGDLSLTRQICNAWKADRAIARVVLREDIARAIALLAGWDGARVMSDNVLWKPPGTRPLGFHQDNAYLAWYRPQELLSCWIALDDTCAEGGTMEVVPGSHRWAHNPPDGEFHGPHDYRASMRRAAAVEGVEPEVVPVVVPSGSGSIHHGWTWHGSGYNRAGRPRRSLVIHVMPASARYNPAHLGEGTGRIYGRYKRLGDDGMDENYFPVTWRRDGHRSAGLDAYCRGSCARREPSIRTR